VTLLELHPLTEALLPAALELDQRCFGGLWSLDGYKRELESPNSELLVLQVAGDRRQMIGDGQKEEETETQGNRDVKSLSPQPSVLSPRSPEPTQNSSPPPTPLLLALGCYWAILEEAHITILAVDPDYQRQGLGQALLYALLNSAHHRGLERSTLEVRISNQSALSLYEKFGFREAGRRKRYYQDTGEDALVLWRGGLQSPEFCTLLQNWWEQVSDRLQGSGWRLSEVWKQPKIKKPYLTCESFSVNNLPSG
jgi:ribosomal-protein-alanine N-acetyltransferase